jgi:hypothetical protein
MFTDEMTDFADFVAREAEVADKILSVMGPATLQVAMRSIRHAISTRQDCIVERILKSCGMKLEEETEKSDPRTYNHRVAISFVGYGGVNGRILSGDDYLKPVDARRYGFGTADEAARFALAAWRHEGVVRVLICAKEFDTTDLSSVITFDDGSILHPSITGVVPA